MTDPILVRSFGPPAPWPQSILLLALYVTPVSRTARRGQWPVRFGARQCPRAFYSGLVADPDLTPPAAARGPRLVATRSAPGRERGGDGDYRCSDHPVHLSGAVLIPFPKLGAGDVALGSAGSRTKSCRLLAPGKVRFCGLPRLVRSCGLLGFTPGPNPRPCARARPPDKSKIAIVAYRRFIVVLRSRRLLGCIGSTPLFRRYGRKAKTKILSLLHYLLK